jgi:hypothetical protein
MVENIHEIVDNADAFHEGEAPFWILHPRGKRKTHWDLCIAFCILYSSLLVPYYLALGITLSGGVYWFDFVVNLLFWMDIGLTFTTGVQTEEDDEIVTDLRQIALTYLKGWLLLDLLCNFPFDALISAVVGGTSTAVNSVKILRILRLIRLIRLMKLGKLSENIAERLMIPETSTQLAKLIAKLILVGHYVACAWVAVAQLHSDSSGINWLEKWQLQSSTPTHQYVAALYYAFTSISTVG